MAKTSNRSPPVSLAPKAPAQSWSDVLALAGQ